MTRQPNAAADLLDHVSNPLSCTEREKQNHQLIIDVFDRLVNFGNETDRPLFCQRLQIIWQEQGICCQSYPTITNQILDLYKLHCLVQEKQGYLEITTNRGWKEISTVLGFGDSGSAAYSVKRNYVRLGLLAYECRFDRAGIDPRSVIELSEMPHTIKKRKRGTHTVASSTARAIVKANKQQLQLLATSSEPATDIDDRHHVSAHPHDSSHQAKYSSRFHFSSTSGRLIPEQMPVHDLTHFALTLRAGRLRESNRDLDTLLVWLGDPSTASYFHLRSLPGLLNAILEQYLACLYELFGSSFLQASPMNDSYIEWFLQSPLRVSDITIGPKSKSHRLESLFFGTRRYVVKRLSAKDPPQSASLVEDIHQENHERHPSIRARCSSLTTIVRNVSFIEENLYLANDRRVLDILERILNCCHAEMHNSYDYHSSTDPRYTDTCSDCSTMLNIDETSFDSMSGPEEPQSSMATNNDEFLRRFTRPPTETVREDPFSCINECEYRHLLYLLDNTFITLSNLSLRIELHRCPPLICYRLINTIVHWIVCSLSLANELFISTITEEPLTSNPSKKTREVFISPRQIALQILANFCTNELNVDCILSNLTTEQLRIFSHALLSIINTSVEDVNREYCLMMMCSLCKRHRTLVHFFHSHRISVEFIFNYLELFEYNQQQYLIATLTSCCYASSTGSMTMPVNHSNDMMIDSCIQLLLLFAPIRGKTYLRAFEHRLVEMSASIYFEQRILKAFADILYVMKS